jgi:hypothetical protein
MSLRSYFLAYSFDPVLDAVAPYRESGLTVPADVRWSLAAEAAEGKGLTAESVRTFAVRWEEKGYKIGLLIRSGQTITVSYAGRAGGQIVLDADSGVTRELADLFEPVEGTQWVGLVPPKSTSDVRAYTYQPPNIVVFRLTINIFPAVSSRQVIPYVGRYPDAPFRDGYMASSWWIPEGARVRDRRGARA